MRNFFKITLLCLLLASGLSPIWAKPMSPAIVIVNKPLLFNDLTIFITIAGIPGSFTFTATGYNTTTAISLSNFSFSEENSISISSLTNGGGAGKATRPTMELTVYLEDAVVDLYKKMMKGETIPEVKIFTYYPFNGTDFRKLEEINLRDVLITEINAEATSEISAPVKHNISLTYNAIWKISPLYPINGGPSTSLSEMKWSYENNTNTY